MEDGVTLDYRDLLGKDFQYGARGPDAYDCYGLMIECRRRVGKYMPEDYLSFEDLHERHLAIMEAARTRFVELCQPQPHCLVTFKIHPRFTTHIGMVLEDGTRFIHILRMMRVGVERLDSPVWLTRITGFWEAIDAGKP